MHNNARSGMGPVPTNQENSCPRRLASNYSSNEETHGGAQNRESPATLLGNKTDEPSAGSVLRCHVMSFYPLLIEWPNQRDRRIQGKKEHAGFQVRLNL